MNCIFNLTRVIRGTVQCHHSSLDYRYDCTRLYGATLNKRRIYATRILSGWTVRPSITLMSCVKMAERTS